MDVHFWSLCFLLSWNRSVDGFVSAPAQGLLAGSIFPNFNEVALWATKDGDKENKRRKWGESYALLVEFYQEHGHADLPRHYKEDPTLGHWVLQQRRRRHSLKADKVSKLDALNFTWDGVAKEKHDQKWEQMFQSLQEYKEEAGDCCVPGKYQPNPKMASWVRTQRRYNTLGKIQSDRFQSLESIGFVWRLKEFSNRTSNLWEQKWDLKFNELLEYRKENGDCHVPQDSPRLGHWVKMQRQLNAEGEIRPDRRTRLDDIGFTWDFEETWDRSWYKLYNQLIEIKEKKQHFSGTSAKINTHTWASPKTHKDVRNWEIRQQDSFKRGTLHPQRKALLAEIGYWDAFDLANLNE